MKQCGMQRWVPEPSPMPHYLCLLPVLLLLFLEKTDGYFDQFYHKPKLLGPHGLHPRFVVAELWANRDM